MRYGDFIQYDADLAGASVTSNAGLREIIRRHLARKTPEQTELVRNHLAGFPEATGERMAECAELFPFHPELIAILEKRAGGGKTALTQVLAEVVQRMLDEPLPEDSAGFISADEIWKHALNRHDWAAAPEIETVVHCSLKLEKWVRRSAARTEQSDLALRLIYALALLRLAGDELYAPVGAAPAELCALLGLPESALAEVSGVLAALLQSVGTPFLARDAGTGECFLVIKVFKRFATAERVLHWVNAIPFLLLLITGGTMLVVHYFQSERAWLSWVKLAHQICAATWLLAMPPTVMLQWNVHWSHLRLMASWSWDDLLWLVQSFRAVFNKQARVPPAGQFNSGQKINAVLVLLYYLGFGGSGLVMFFKSSILFPWYVHTALFFAALGSVGGHLYMSLVNPGTRIALMGIFRGWVPLKYIEHHHPLSLPASLRSHIGQPSRRTIREELAISKAEIIILAITVLLGGLGVVAFSQGQMVKVRAQFAKSFADTISPSQLSTKHRIGPPSESCVKCHSYTGQIPNDKCEDCHKDIKAIRAGGIGYHGTLKDDCRVCHKEHPDGTRNVVPLDRRTFDHNLARFKLEGKHVKTECDECHKKKRTKEMKGSYFTGLNFAACTDCHQDPHNRQFTVACEKCHSASGWTQPNLKFGHNTDSTYRLEGKHEKVDCAKCHKPRPPEAKLGTALFKGLRTDCAGCHDEDAHRKQFTKNCEACHSTAGWQKQELLFNHDRDCTFPLLAKHAQTECVKCHLPSAPGERLALAPMHKLKAGCVDCHKDPHGSQFGNQCTTCHPTPDSWKDKALRFNHDRDSKFLLVGRHIEVKCVDCHQPPTPGSALATAQFRNMPMACESCHKVKHPAEYGLTCLSCHSLAQRWIKQSPVADHVSRHAANDELLVGKHITARCDACHNPAMIPTLAHLGQARYDCYTCHDATPDPHQGALGTVCNKCHNSEGWKGENLRFNHDTMTRYPLDQDHRQVACVKCHENNRWKPLETTCVACHTKFREDKKTAPMAR